MRMVREFLGAVTDDDLSATRPNPHAPEYQETVLSCMRTILEEEWEHLRFVTRDLNTLDERAPQRRASVSGSDDLQAESSC